MDGACYKIKVVFLYTSLLKYLNFYTKTPQPTTCSIFSTHQVTTIQAATTTPTTILHSSIAAEPPNNKTAQMPYLHHPLKDNQPNSSVFSIKVPPATLTPCSRPYTCARSFEQRSSHCPCVNSMLRRKPILLKGVSSKCCLSSRSCLPSCS